MISINTLVVALIIVSWYGLYRLLYRILLPYYTKKMEVKT